MSNTGYSILNNLELWTNHAEHLISQQSEETQLWINIATVATLVITLAEGNICVRPLVKWMNRKLVSKEGWKPIRLSTVLWAGSSL